MKMMTGEIDENKLDIKYYELLVRQHHYVHRVSSNEENLDIKMEHSYTRDSKAKDIGPDIPKPRTILIERTPPCPSCNLDSHDDKLNTLVEISEPVVPYDETASQVAMLEAEHTIRNNQLRSDHSDDDDWTLAIDKTNWSERQSQLFRRVERVLDLDQMARLAYSKRSGECLRRRSSIDKSVSRMRQALSTIQWDADLTQWLHVLLIKNLTPSYMVSYIEILQSLRQKAPVLVDRMLQTSPIEMESDYKQTLSKQPWQPPVKAKLERLPAQVVIVVMPSSPARKSSSGRWCQLLSKLAPVVPIRVAPSILQTLSLEQLLEHTIAVAREKINVIRNEKPNHKIILVGFNAGAAMTLQIAMAETFDAVVCVGFAFNTVNGSRGASDDHLLKVISPTLFVLGQNAQRSSQEEIESLRDKMAAHTSLVVVGSADDSLRMRKMNRQTDSVTQPMIDNMVMQEIRQFTLSCILNPPEPRMPSDHNTFNGHPGRAVFLPLSPNNPSPIKRLERTNRHPVVSPNKSQKAKRKRDSESALYPASKKRKSTALNGAMDVIAPVKYINKQIPPLYPLKIDSSKRLHSSTLVSNSAGMHNHVKKRFCPPFDYLVTDDEVTVPNETKSTYSMISVEDMARMPVIFAGDDNNNSNVTNGIQEKNLLNGSPTTAITEIVNGQHGQVKSAANIVTKNITLSIIRKVIPQSTVTVEL